MTKKQAQLIIDLLRLHTRKISAIGVEKGKINWDEIQQLNIEIVTKEGELYSSSTD